MFASLTLKRKNDMVFKKSYRRNVFPVLFFEKGMLPFPTTLPSPPCPERFGGDSSSPPLRNIFSRPFPLCDALAWLPGQPLGLLHAQG